MVAREIFGFKTDTQQLARFQSSSPEFREKCKNIKY